MQGPVYEKLPATAVGFAMQQDCLYAHFVD